MSMLDKLKGLLKGHEDQAEKAVDMGAGTADERTGGRYSDQVDTAKQKLNEQLGAQDQPGDQPPQA